MDERIYHNNSGDKNLNPPKHSKNQYNLDIQKSKLENGELSHTKSQTLIPSEKKNISPKKISSANHDLECTGNIIFNPIYKINPSDISLLSVDYSNANNPSDINHELKTLYSNISSLAKRKISEDDTNLSSHEHSYSQGYISNVSNTADSSQNLDSQSDEGGKVKKIDKKASDKKGLKYKESLRVSLDKKPSFIQVTMTKKLKNFVLDHFEEYSAILEYLTSNSFLILRQLGKYVMRQDLEVLSKAFFIFLNWKEVTLDYVKSCIRQDVEHSDNDGTLFRTSNLFTGILSNYCKTVGAGYLQEVLKPNMTWLKESNLEFEIDQNIIDSSQVNQNIFNLNYLANKFFKSILNSINIIPFELREISDTLYKAVSAKFPNSHYSALGGFFFLRFVVPAVFSPENFDLVEYKFDEKKQRALILVAKTLQQIANNQKFSEPHMDALNSFIQKWTTYVHRFFDELVQKDYEALKKKREEVLSMIKSDQETYKKMMNDSVINSIVICHKFILKQINVLVKSLEYKEEELGYNPASELKKLLDEMGNPFSKSSSKK